MKVKFLPLLKALRCISAFSWGSSTQSHFFCEFSFFSAAFHLCFTRMFSFSQRYQYYESLNAFTEWPVAPSSPASHPPLSLFSSLSDLYFPYWSPGLILLCHIMSRHFVSQPPFPFRVWPDLEGIQGYANSPGELLCPLTRSCFLLLLGSLLALPLLGTCHSSLWGLTLLSPCSRSNSTLSRQGAALAHLDSLPHHHLMIWTDGLVTFPFGKGGFGVSANCLLCGTEAAVPFR